MNKEKNNSKNDTFEKISKYMSDKGFVYGPSPEIYNGISGFFTYGPLGKLLKNNIELQIRNTFQKNDFFEIECPIVMPKIVWEASGHLGNFTDPIIKCSKCKSIFRADKLIEDLFTDTEFSDILLFIKEHNIRCPSCGAKLEEKIENQNLMLKTIVGTNTESYNRPETATTTYLPFKRYLNFFRDKLPFGVFQIGKAFRNEISPRNGIIRQREFTQAEGQIFVFENEKKDYQMFDKYRNLKIPMIPYQNQKEKFIVEEITLEEALKNKYIQNKAYGYGIAMAYTIFKSMGFNNEDIRFRQHRLDERAFYAIDAWDLEIKTNSFGWLECCGIHDRGNYDLSQHEKFSKTELKARNEELKRKEIPHIIEIAFGVDRPLFALIDINYKNDEKRGNIVMDLKNHIAPIKACICPLVNKLNDKATEIYQDLKEKTNLKLTYDKSGSIGKRYARADEIGIKYMITIDFETLNDNKVTIRNITTTNQERVDIEEILDYIK